MKRKFFSILCVLLAFMTLFSGFAGAGEGGGAAGNSDGTAKINSVNDLAGRRVATLRGSTLIENLIEQAIPSCDVVLYDTVQELSEYLSAGYIDAFISEESTTVVQNYPDLCVIASLGDSNCATVFPKTEEGERLRDEFNAFLTRLSSDGSLEVIRSSWVKKGEGCCEISLDALTGENGAVDFAVSTFVGAPFTYAENGEYLGYEIELAYRFCAEYGYKLTVTDYDFPSLLEAVRTGKAQMGASCITVSEQRKETLLFSDITYSSSFQLVVRAADTDIISKEYLTADDVTLAERFAGKTIGAETGTIHGKTVAALLPESKISFYNTVDEISAALESGEIDAFADDEPTARMYIGQHEGQYIAGYLDKCNYAYAFPKTGGKSEKLISQMNEFLAELIRSGDLEKIDEIWFGSDENKKVVNYSSLTGENGTLTFAVSTSTAGVFAYEKNGEYVGYDVDIAVRFCEKYGYGITVVDSNFSAMLASVAAGRCDFAGSVITVTEERKKNIDFSQPNYYGSVVLVSKQRSDSDTPVLSDTSLLGALDGCKMGILSGTIYDRISEEYTPKSTLMYFNSVTDMCIALDSGIIDAFYADQPQGRIAKKYYPDQYIYAVVCLSNNGMIFPKGSLDSDILRSQIDQYLAEIKENGVFKEINELWFGDDEANQVVDYASLTGENGVLNVATSSMVGEPFAYIKDGQMVGYDLDMICRFCKEYGYGMNVTDYDFPGMLAAVSTGKADIGAACITITEERKETMNFSEANYYSGGIIIAKDGSITAQTEEQSGLGKFLGRIKESFNKTFIRESRWKLFTGGIGTTVLITVLSILLGTALGFVIYLLYRQNCMAVNHAVDFICGILSKTPTVLILMILFYIVFANAGLDGIWVSVIGFTILFAGSITQLLKVSVQAVNKGQREAALSLGYTETAAFIKVILPQALKQFVPVYKAEIVSLIKSTAIVGYIAVQDLTKISDIVRARTFEPFFALIISTVIYILISTLFIALVERIWVSRSPQKRSAEKILKGVKTK